MYKIFNIYLLPAFTFQTIIIAGGYGTGQELLVFFLKKGPINGLLGLLVTLLIWCFTCSLSYGLVRLWKSYNYKLFFQKLLGKKWFLFEINYMLLIFIVLSVAISSLSNISKEVFSLPKSVSCLIFTFAVVFFTLLGNIYIKKLFAIWSIFLTLVFIFLFIFIFRKNAFFIIHNIYVNGSNINSYKVILSGCSYAFYNIGLIPAAFFSLKYINNNKEAYLSGVLTGIISMIPAMLFYLCLLSSYPVIVVELIPVIKILNDINKISFSYIFCAILLGSLLQTGIALIHSFNERLNYNVVKKSRISIIFSALFWIANAILFTKFGLINLISKGYLIATFLICMFYILPLIIIYLKKFSKGIFPE